MRYPRLMLPAVLMLTVVGCAPTPPASKLVRVDDGPERDTRLADSLNQRGAQLIESGDTAAAERVLKQSIAADPDFGPAHNNLGALYFAQSSAAQSKLFPAAREFELAAALMPSDPRPRNGLGLVLESSGRFDDAVTYYDRARALDRGSVEFLGNAARARARRGDQTDELRAMLVRLTAEDQRPQWRQWEQAALKQMSPPQTQPAR